MNAPSSSRVNVLSLLAWFAIVLLCLTGVINSPLSKEPWIWTGAWLCVGAFMSVAWTWVARAWTSIASWRWIGVAIGVLVVVVHGWLAHDVFSATPLIQDEINYDAIARLLLKGKLTSETPLFIDFVQYRFFVGEERFYSLFQPGWPAFLAIGHVVGLPWLVNPVLAGISTALLHDIGRRLFNIHIALGAALIALLSAYWWTQGASMMAHTCAGMLGLAALWAALRYDVKPEHKRWLVLSGACLGIAFCVRAATAVTISLPIIIAGIWRIHDQKRSWGDMAWFVLGLAPTGCLQLLYNWELSGHPLHFPQDRYFALTEPTASCHRLGIGADIGCPYEHGPDLNKGAGGYTWRRALEVTMIRLGQLRVGLFGAGLVVWAVIFAYTSAARIRATLLIGGMFLSVPAIYFFYYYPAHYWGARYYFDAAGYFILLVACGLAVLTERALTIEGVRGRVLASLVLSSVCIAGPAYHVLKKGPELASHYRRGWGFFKDMNNPQTTLPSNAVIIMPNASRSYWAGFTQNSPDFQGDTVLVRDWGRRMNAGLHEFFPRRDFYRPRRSKGRVVFSPTTIPATPNRVFFEGEAKFPVPRREGGYARPQGLRAWKKTRASRREHLFFEAAQQGAWFEVHQHIPVEGMYTMSAGLTQGPDYGRVQFSLDGQPFTTLFDGFAASVQSSTWQASKPVRLSKGMHTIRLSVAGRAPKSKGWVAGLDYVEFTRKP